MISSEYVVHEINKLDLMHRKGWRPSEGIGKQVEGEHLKDEVSELLFELKWYASPECPQAEEDKAEVKQEMGDVLACLLQIAYRFGWSFEEINQEAVRKLRLRFLGADKIQIPGEQNDSLSTTPCVYRNGNGLLYVIPDGKRPLPTRGLPCS